VLEETFDYPNPDIVIRAVSSYADIKHLVGQDEHNSVIYFYTDRAVKTHLLSYTGETEVAVLSRYAATHSKSDWLKTIELPLIGACASRGRRWDTDTRRSIEATVVSLMHNRGFSIVNQENKSWRGGDTIRAGVNRLLVEQVAEQIVTCQLAWLGLPREAPTVIGHGESTNESEIPKSLPMDSSIWTKPQAGRKLYASSGARKVWGEQTAEGLVLLTRAEHIPAVTKEYAPLSLREKHAQLLREGVRNADGTYNWEGRTTPDRPTSWLGATAGLGVQNSWQLLT
jgi:hypothetical protein